FLWQIVHDKLDGGRVHDWPERALESCPAVRGDRLWYVNNRAEVVCAVASTGAEVWNYDLIGKLGVFPHAWSASSPLLVGDTLFLVTGNGLDRGHLRLPAPNAPSFLALDARTGRVRWRSSLPGRGILHGQWSNPVYAEAGGKAQVVFPGGDGILYSCDPKTGELLWKFDCNPKGARAGFGGRATRLHFMATPTVWQGKLCVGTGEDPEHRKGVGHLWCIDIAKTPKNKDKDLSPWSPPGRAPADFDPKDPRNKDSGLVWHYGGDAPEDHGKEYFFGRTLSTCAVHDRLCYAADYDGRVYCFDARTGKKHWEHEMKAETMSSPLWADGHVWIGNEKGQVLVFKHGKVKKLVRTNAFGRGCKVRAPLAALGGTLYVVTENPCRLWAIGTKGKP
ncbi:MAG: PQQ-binding-like beta-propeller repeat protein, partial [Gemmataceae bacterium]|nr:PQQ-binding-like beta-propeller repeat protein [Gemmataceae bacterium]